jgi:GGDEF domain-containing protein
MYKAIGKIILNKIRVNDFFGKFDNGKFIILTASTSLSGAMILAEKIKQVFKDDKDIDNKTNIFIGITQSSDIDTLNSVLEKLYDAINRAKSNDTQGGIEIET